MPLRMLAGLIDTLALLSLRELFFGFCVRLACQPTYMKFFFLAKIAWLLQQLIGLTLTLMYNSELAIFTVSKMKI